MEIGHRIFNIRKETGLNQADFGKRIGVTRSAICNYENGSRSVGEQVILSICREFNVSETWLRTGAGEMFINRSRDEELAAFVDELLTEKSADFRRRLVTALSRMTPEQWDALEAVALDLMKEPAVPTLAPTPQPAERETDPTPDLTKELAELKRQNRELSERLEAIEKEDAKWEAAHKEPFYSPISGR